MTNQKLSTYVKEMPEFLKPKYLIKRINEEDIEITENQRNGILKSMEAGIRFVQLDNYTLMLNSIKSIDPKWGKYNIPLRPTERTVFKEIKGSTAYVTVTNKDEISAWDYWYGNKITEYGKQLQEIDRKNGDDKEDGLYWWNFKMVLIESEDDEQKTIAEKIIDSREKLVQKYGEIDSKKSLGSGT